jgi:tetratricopeptide (TPR) repeat protein
MMNGMNGWWMKRGMWVALVGMVSMAGAQDLPEPFLDYTNCEGDCEEAFRRAVAYAESVKPDTAKARLFIELTDVRKNRGIWDDEVKELYVRATEIYRKTGNLCHESNAIRFQSNFHMYREEGDLALELARKALEMAEDCGNERTIARSNGVLGLALQHKGEYAEALKYHGKSAAMFRDLGDLTGQAVSTQELAYIYGSMGDMEKANEMMLESAEIYKASGDDMSYAICVTDLCANYLTLEQPDSVLKYLPEAREVLKGTNKMGEAVATYNIGEAYKQKDEYRRALDIYDESAALAADLEFPRFYLEIEISRSECYTGLKEYEAAYERIAEAEKYADQTASVEGKMNILQFKMYAAHDVGKHEESHQAALDYIDMKDSLRSIARDEQVAAMQEELEAEKREHEIVMLEREKEMETQKKNGLFLIIALVIVGSGVALNREVQRRKKSKQLHEAEIRVKEADEKLLREELAFKKRELASKALHISQKNEVLENLRTELQKLARDEEADRSVREVLNQLKIERSIDGNWEEFTRQFQEVNPEFYRRLSDRAPEMTKSELRLAALLKMNLSSKEIASVLNISPDGVKKARHRFRKKLDLESEDSLEQFILNL